MVRLVSPSIRAIPLCSLRCVSLRVAIRITMTQHEFERRREDLEVRYRVARKSWRRAIARKWQSSSGDGKRSGSQSRRGPLRLRRPGLTGMGPSWTSCVSFSITSRTSSGRRTSCASSASRRTGALFSGRFGSSSGKDGSQSSPPEPAGSRPSTVNCGRKAARRRRNSRQNVPGVVTATRRNARPPRRKAPSCCGSAPPRCGCVPLRCRSAPSRCGSVLPGLWSVPPRCGNARASELLRRVAGTLRCVARPSFRVAGALRKAVNPFPIRRPAVLQKALGACSALVRACGGGCPRMGLAISHILSTRSKP